MITVTTIDAEKGNTEKSDKLVKEMKSLKNFKLEKTGETEMKSYITLHNDFEDAGLLDSNLSFSPEFHQLSSEDRYDALFNFITRRAYASIRNYRPKEYKYLSYEKAENIAGWFATNTDHPHPRYTFEQLATSERRHPEARFHKEVCRELANLVVMNILNFKL